MHCAVDLADARPMDGGAWAHVICQPVVLEAIDILFRHWVHILAMFLAASVGDGLAHTHRISKSTAYQHDESARR